MKTGITVRVHVPLLLNKAGYLCVQGFGFLVERGETQDAVLGFRSRQTNLPKN
jgi:hypothetical protein